MTMQRRHFEWIAQAIKDMEAPTYVAREFAMRLRATNPNFNPSRFLRACGVES